MVLNTLGQQLSSALSRLTKAEDVDEKLIKELVNDIARALISSDVNIGIVKKVKTAVEQRLEELLQESANINKARAIERIVVEELVAMLDPGKEPYKLVRGRPNVIMFVGLQGAGKTTTVAKYAHYYQQRKWRVAMVCADTFRAGAFDQLKQNATRVRVPFYGSYTESDPVKIAAEGVAQFKKEGYEIILVDTSGRHKQEASLFEEMQQVERAVDPDEVVFVMDSSIGQAAQGQAQAFREAVSVGSVIITKLDGHAKGGGALSAVAATGSPIVFFGSGEHFNDLQSFNAERFIGKLLGKGDLRGLAVEMKEKGIMSNISLDKFAKGKFTLGDMRDQLSQVMKLGSLSKIAEAMPGQLGQMMSQMSSGMGGDGFGVFKQYLTLMDSLTQAELDGEVEVTPPRLQRACNGSGVRPDVANQFMIMYKQFADTMGSMAKTGLLKNENALAKAMRRDPRQVMGQLQKSIQPGMLQQVGGVENLMKMMGQMDMGGMAKALGLGGGGGMGGGMGGRAAPKGGKGRAKGGPGGMPGGMPDLEAMANDPNMMQMMGNMMKQFGLG